MCLEMETKDGCIIHRDIKLQNILIAIDDKTADMAMAQSMDPSKISFDSENCGTLFCNATTKTYSIEMKQSYDKYEIESEYENDNAE